MWPESRENQAKARLGSPPAEWVSFKSWSALKTLRGNKSPSLDVDSKAVPEFPTWREVPLSRSTFHHCTSYVFSTYEWPCLFNWNKFHHSINYHSWHWPFQSTPCSVSRANFPQQRNIYLFSSSPGLDTEGLILQMKNDREILRKAEDNPSLATSAT